MSETCIVCLGDLGENVNDLPRSDAAAIKSEVADHGAPPVTLKSPLRGHNPDAEMIAHLLPCGHDLHNECLKPWVERANSCPICRQAFNQVDLSLKVGGKSWTQPLSWQPLIGIVSGPVVSSYPVADRTQVEEIDPSMFTEDVEDDFELQPCPLCGDDDNEDHLLSCDGCGVDYHTYCVALDEVPLGHWFCEACDTQRAIESVAHPAPRAQPQYNTSDRRTRAQRRRARGGNAATSTGSGWARVWQSVWDRLNLDLDFPYDEGSSASRANRSQVALAQQQEWRRRLRVAERQPGPNRFRDTAPTLLDTRNARGPQQPPSPAQTLDEIRAWDSFDRAMKEESTPVSNRRKRKSPTTSPSDADPIPQPQQPERQLKRPRTRRNLDHVEPQSDASVDAPTSRRSSIAALSSRRPNVSDLALRGQDQGPSFLQSLLKEVESSAVSDQRKRQDHPSLSTATGRSSPLLSSPGISPTASNYASPRALSTTPPPSTHRPGSPLSLTSKDGPLYPPSDFSPSSPELPLHATNESHRLDAHRTSRHRHQSPPATSPPRSTNTSPSRLTMSLSAKSDLQKMVTAALKPYYKSNVVNKDQYTDINRDVSRMLYDTVGDQERINDANREKWERVAIDEVAKAVKTLRQPA